MKSGNKRNLKFNWRGSQKAVVMSLIFMSVLIILSVVYRINMNIVSGIAVMFVLVSLIIFAIFTERKNDNCDPEPNNEKDQSPLETNLK